MNTNEKLITHVLLYTGCPSVPEAVENDNDGRIWVKAIAKVRKCNNVEGFAVITNVYDGVPRILKVFDDYGVGEILSIHPYEWLEEKVCEKIRTASANPRSLRLFISEAYGIPSARLKTVTVEKATALAWNWCIRRQIELDKDKNE